MSSIHPDELCEGCRRRAKRPGERFCLGCRRALKREMKESGYIEGCPYEEDEDLLASYRNVEGETTVGGIAKRPSSDTSMAGQWHSRHWGTPKTASGSAGGGPEASKRKRSRKQPDPPVPKGYEQITRWLSPDEEFQAPGGLMLTASDWAKKVARETGGVVRRRCRNGGLAVFRRIVRATKG